MEPIFNDQYKLECKRFNSNIDSHWNEYVQNFFYSIIYYKLKEINSN